LHQHVPEHQQSRRAPGERVHLVLVDTATRFGARYPDELTVNTYHHQTVDRLGDGLRVVGRAPDGAVEMLEHARHRIGAVQWHPELLDDLDPGFTWLVEQARPG
jgi:putative glutamine amidotransferase